MTCISTCPCRCHGCTTSSYDNTGCHLCLQNHTFTTDFPDPNLGVPAVTTHTHIEPFDYHPEIIRLLTSIDKKLDKIEKSLRK